MIASTLELLNASPSNSLNPPASSNEIINIERIIGHQLPDDLRTFYLAHNGGGLHINSGGASIFKVQNICLAWPLVYNTPIPPTHGNIYALIDMGDCNYIGFAPRDDGAFDYIDIFKETFFENWSKVIDNSFNNILMQLAKKPGSFWL